MKAGRGSDRKRIRHLRVSKGQGRVDGRAINKAGVVKKSV